MWGKKKIKSRIKRILAIAICKIEKIHHANISTITIYKKPSS
jgi:hypothetical protein